MKYLFRIFSVTFITIAILLATGCTVVEPKDTIFLKEESDLEVQTENQIKDTEDVKGIEEPLYTAGENPNRIMFNNCDVNFAFVYPQNNLTIASYLSQTGPYGDLSLNVSIARIEDLVGDDKEIAVKEQGILAEGNFGEDNDFIYKPSKKVLKIGDVYVKEFIVFGRYYVCDVTFERRAVFYNNGYRVTINLIGNEEKIMRSMEDFFKTDNLNCDEKKVWDLDKQNEFYDTLISKKASVSALEWYSTFDSILELLQINDFKGASAGYNKIIDKRIYEENKEKRYIISAAYPKFQSAVKGDLDSTINDSVLNKTVLTLIDDFKTEIESYGQDEYINDYINYFLAIDYYIVMYSDKAVSFNLDIYPYLGGAHGMQYFETFNYDLVNSSVLGLENIFKPEFNYLVFLSDYCSQDIKDQTKNYGFELDEEWIKDGTDPGNKDNFKYFLITPEELIIKFLAYQVGPYAAGDFTVKIPYDAFREHINPDSILGNI